MTLGFRTAMASQAQTGQKVAFGDSVEILPLQDVRVAILGPGLTGEGRRQGPSADLIRLTDATSSPTPWRLRLGSVDWPKYGDWQLAVRVQFPQTGARRLRVDLCEPSSLHAVRLSHRVELQDDEISSIKRRGFCDLLIPLHLDAGADSLKDVAELAIVLEPDPAAPTDGTPREPLRVHSVRLVSPRQAGVRQAAELLDALADRALLWFEAYRNPRSGLVPDRAPNWRQVGGLGDARKIPCSIASMGYYLSILPDAVQMGRLTEPQARERALTAMEFLASHADHHAGFLHHFLDMETGKPMGSAEVSVLDSAILFNGCMVSSVYFRGDVAEAADRLLDRVDWGALLAPTTGARPQLLAMAWEPRRGVYGPMDVRSSEFAMACFLAIGSPAQGLDTKVWTNTAVKKGTVEGQTLLNPTHGLFTSYFGLGWHMLEGRRDPDGVDLWANARASALANRARCRAARDETYQQEWGCWWGISAGDSPTGYIAPGLVGGGAGGTVWPTAALAALPWAPQEIEQDVVAWSHSPLWDYVLGPYGLSPFNIQKRWIGTDLIGIDLGSFYLGVANHRRGTVWNLWKQHPIAQRALARIYARQ
jgi:hypothetical protein